MRGYGRRTLVLSFVVGLVGLVGPAPASAATQVGATFAPSTACGSPGDPGTSIQRSSPAALYVVPSAGVITSWSVQSGPNPVMQVKLKLARPAGGNNFTIVAESAAQTPVAIATSNFTTRIPVSGGELLGRFSIYGLGDCEYETFAPGLGNVMGQKDVSSDAPVGSTDTYTASSNDQLDVSATLEPDADGDGFGDETQDQCPTDASKQGDCAPPDTTITAGPKAKTKKKKATFEFTSTEPGSTFECSLNGAPFAACTSPDEVKGKKGKNHFEVRATDVAGNADGSPATADWKVKKKKK
jgi:hypothetical protein